MSVRELGQSNVPVLHVEDGGAVLRGLALPFGEPAIVGGPEPGTLVAEIMDEQSITRIAPNLPLLVGHDRARPAVGVVRSSAVTPQGVMIEAELVGSDDELEGWRRRFREGLSAGLSVGFTRDRTRTVFERPRSRGELPIVRPRGVVIVETSLVNWPAYERAGVVSLSVRTAFDQEQHEGSERTILSMQLFSREVAARQARRREGH